MVFVEKSWKILLAALAAMALFVSLASAAVPSYYKGVPYPIGSIPKEIPGRINFHDYDAGGPNVSFEQDDMASQHFGGCTAGLRDTGIYKDGDSDHPSFSMTNHDPAPEHSPDTFYATGVSFPNGVKYPSSDTSFAASHWYIGAIHPNDFFNVTIHVSKPGNYWISSIWAAMETNIYYEMFFIGTQYAATKDTIKTNVVHLTGYNSYHAWRRYADFTSIQLDSGIQVMKFHTLSYHLNLDFLHFAADSGNFPTEVTQPSVKPFETGSFNLSMNRETVRFTLTNAGKTRIALFDCIGREIMQVLNRDLPSGNHSVSLNTIRLKQGIYFVRIEHGGTTNVAKFHTTR
jgi:hypothetical protein